MRIHYAGKFDGDVSKLPHRKHEKNAVGFKEAETVEEVEKVGLKVLPAILVIETIPLILLRINPFSLHISSFFAGLTLAILTLPVHEVLHAVCFRGDVYIFSNLKRGMAFTVGTESMSKRHFLFMSLFPDILLGLIPYGIFLISNRAETAGIMGFLALATGVGDYINAWHCISQMPKGSLTYMSGINSYWYIK